MRNRKNAKSSQPRRPGDQNPEKLRPTVLHAQRLNLLWLVQYSERKSQQKITRPIGYAPVWRMISLSANDHASRLDPGFNLENAQGCNRKYARTRDMCSKWQNKRDIQRKCVPIHTYVVCFLQDLSSCEKYFAICLLHIRMNSYDLKIFDLDQPMKTFRRLRTSNTFLAFLNLLKIKVRFVAIEKLRPEHL